MFLGKFKSREWRRTLFHEWDPCDDLTKEWELWKLSVIIDRYSLFTITMIRCQHTTHWRAGDRGGQISVCNPIHLRLSLKTAHPQQAHYLCPISRSHNSGEIQKPRIAQDPCDDLIIWSFCIVFVSCLSVSWKMYVVNSKHRMKEVIRRLWADFPCSELMFLQMTCHIW